MTNLKVLIVEDDADLAEVEKEQLQMSGFNVELASNAELAISFINKKKFDCILLDMNLNGKSGKDVIYSSRLANSLNYETPIIVISGGLNLDVVREVRDKTSAIIVKPFSPNELSHKIEDIVSKAKSNKQIKKPIAATSSLNHKIFLVDDDQEYTQELKKFLEGENFTVVTSYNSQDASTKLQNQRFDLMITDLNIDQRSGEWLVNIIRRDSSHLNHKTPVIVVSGFINTSSPRLGGMIQENFEKPITFLRLLQAIQKQLPKINKSMVKLI